MLGTNAIHLQPLISAQRAGQDNRALHASLVTHHFR